MAIPKLNFGNDRLNQKIVGVGFLQAYCNTIPLQSFLDTNYHYLLDYLHVGQEDVVLLYFLTMERQKLNTCYEEQHMYKLFLLP